MLLLINIHKMPSQMLSVNYCSKCAEFDMSVLHIQSKMVLLQEVSSMEAIEEQKALEDGEPSVATEKEGT